MLTDLQSTDLLIYNTFKAKFESKLKIFGKERMSESLSKLRELNEQAKSTCQSASARGDKSAFCEELTLSQAEYIYKHQILQYDKWKSRNTKLSRRRKAKTYHEMLSRCGIEINDINLGNLTIVLCHLFLFS